MSSRTLKKLRGNEDLNILKESLAKQSSDEEEESQITTEKLTKSVNVFDLLNDIDTASNDEDSGIYNNTDAICEDLDQNVNMPVAFKSAKKKRKKKKQKSLKEKNSEHVEPDLEQILSEVNRISLQNSSNIISNHTSHDQIVNSKSVLTVIRKHLNVDNELRKMFGSDVVDANSRSRNSNFRKKNYIFSTPKNNWPPISKYGVQMVVDKTENGITFFKYVHSKANYQKLQQLFWKASHSADPHAVRQILEMHPYHIDTLLHLSEVCRVSEDTQTSSDLLSRALLCLENAFHPSFNVASSFCRLDYNRSENRALFIALFRQILFVSLKSCWKTAFELSKLLYNLSPEQDPLACLLIIDVLALKVEDYNFVLQFIEDYNHSLRITQLPNFAYSHALAQFYKETVGNSSHKESDELLQSAILNYPIVSQLICDKCSFVINSNPMYIYNEKVIKSHSRSLQQQCKLYVERSVDLWKDASVAFWYKQNVDFVNKEHLKMPQYEFASRNQKNTFLSPPLNVMRHIFIADISSVSALLPPAAFEIAQDPHDPLPPSNSYSDYHSESRPSASGNPVVAFIDSLMPGYNQNAQNGEIQGVELGGLLHPADADNGVGQWGEQLRNVPGDFGVILRDMINNLYIQNNEDPIPYVADENDNSTSSVEEEDTLD